LGYLEQGLRATYLYKRNKDYLVQSGKVVIVDEFTGRLMPGRRWSDGLHQAVEAKEGVKVENESVTYATVTIQNYFRMYQKLAGMTGTAVTESEEFNKIYKLDVMAIPTNLEYQAIRADAALVEEEAKDEEGYKFRFYTYKNDAQKKPVYYRRQDYPDVVYRTEEIKLRAIMQEILRYHSLGRPVLVGTTSVELSERVSNRLRAEPLRRLTQVLLLRKKWMEKHNLEEDGRQVAELVYLNSSLDQFDLSEMRKMARELGMPFSPDDPANHAALLEIYRLETGVLPRLLADLQGGIPHEVLNARKHTEESQIIAGAGAFGAVTIATNMAGRGVDIKLGGELAEEILAAVNRLLTRAGYQDAYDMNMEQRRAALQNMDPAEYGIYDAEVGFFFKHMDDMERVRVLGGLHVIGSERHEARRIDNQLRGRAARQGDPGSSRFYLSMEDDLMRLFGGQQADAMMQRLKIDEHMPLEMNLVSRIVEGSQSRVEGSNFDVRKHLLEYDDVLNTQRNRIYEQRSRIFHKDDLSEDVTEMLRTEVVRRVPEALKDEEGPWKLLSWLETIQPTIQYESEIFPSYTLRLLAGSILPDDGSHNGLSRTEAIQALSRISLEALQAEQRHVTAGVLASFAASEERLDEQIRERQDAVDTFFEGMDVDDESGDARRPSDLVNELSGLVHIPLKLTIDQQRALKSDPASIKPVVVDQVETLLSTQMVVRIIGGVERRLEESLDLNLAQIPTGDWQALQDAVLEAVEEIYTRRRERYLGENGAIVKDLEVATARLPEPLDQAAIYDLLRMIPQGAKASFDKKTHRRVWQVSTRLNYVYYAAHFLAAHEPDAIGEDVLDHLEEAQEFLRDAWGRYEFNRLSGFMVNDFDERARSGLENALGPDYIQVVDQPLGALTGAGRDTAIDELGRQVLTEIYRQLVLQVITDLWVDYLTQMEALRVSVGLEAYGQRDPLVQYKKRASELFGDLLADMRLGVISRMYTFRPRTSAGVQAVASGRKLDAGDNSEEALPPGNGSAPLENLSEGIDSEDSEQDALPAGNRERVENDPGKKKRRRHR
jgi:preprotein translocase subunit SecA